MIDLRNEVFVAVDGIYDRFATPTQFLAEPDLPSPLVDEDCPCHCKPTRRPRTCLCDRRALESCRRPFSRSPALKKETPQAIWTIRGTGPLRRLSTARI